MAEIINRHLPTDPRADYDHGRVLSLLMAARLCKPVALSNVATWAAQSGADILWDIDSEKLNDDRLGRSLDAFFEQRHSIPASVALHVANEFGTPLSELHYDPTERETGKTIPCRVIFVFSTADQRVARKNREKSTQKLRTGLEEIAKSVADGRRNTDPTSIARRVGKLFGKRQAATHFSCEMVPLSKSERDKLPPPQRGCKRPTHRFEFRYDEAAAQQDAEYDGYSLLVTTAARTQSADLLFTQYKQQSYSELANHEFKKPLAVHPVFLKSPHRVEALVFLLMLTLTLYFLIQRLYRQNVPDDAPVKEQRTTTETILHAFNSYALILHRTRIGREVQPTRLTTRQRQILQQLGFSTPAQILSRQLPRAP